MGNWIYAGLMVLAIVAYLTKQRYLRPVILLTSRVVVGFLQMACPSPSGSLQNTLFYWGEWTRVIPFAVTVLIVLIPSFFIGKIFCGWVCHKGAVQEFLFQKKFSIKVPHRIDYVLRFGKYLVLALVIIVPLLFHYRILNSSIQPFKVIFNLGGPMIAIILMGLIAVSSIFIYRPFCRYLCPVGAFLGLASMVGLNRLKIDKTGCTSCKRCEKNCEIAAISTPVVLDGVSKPEVNNAECIMCGECQDECTKKCIC